MLCNSVQAADTTRALLFKDTVSAFDQARAARAELYAPENYDKAMDNFKDAEEAYTDGEKISTISEYLQQADTYFSKATDISNRASALFAKTMSAKYDALNVKANTYDTETWEAAEDLLKEGIEENEDNDLANARVYAEKAEKLFRKAEMTSVKITHLKAVWQKFEKLEDMGRSNYAPHTFEKAKKLAAQVEIELTRQPYGNDKARELVNEASYEADHAMYLSKKIAELNSKDKSFEYVINGAENHISAICAELDIVPRFDNGLTPPVKQIIDTLRDFKQSQKLNNAKIRAMKAEINELNLTEEELRLSQKKAEMELEQKRVLLERQKIKKQKIQKISAAFSHDEGMVLLHGDNVIIRLYGVTFDSGKAVIDYQYFALLSKVRNTFAEFPGCSIIIEGHTDAIGSDLVNKKLSLARAEAVRQYILANSDLSPTRIKAIGYGESKPVASNETSVGQAKNRRIDVIIIPSYK